MTLSCLLSNPFNMEVQITEVPSPRHRYSDRNPDLTEDSLRDFENWYA
eukprot:COSAG01_NODE_1414_length_10397_cov_8.813653_6_plen_48_part_00